MIVLFIGMWFVLSVMFGIAYAHESSLSELILGILGLGAVMAMALAVGYGLSL